MKALLLAMSCLFAVAAVAPAFAQTAGKTCTTTCTGNASNGGKTCTKTCR
jgi:hypothetical protein